MSNCHGALTRGPLDRNINSLFTRCAGQSGQSMESESRNITTLSVDDVRKLVSLLGLERFEEAGLNVSFITIDDERLRMGLSWAGVGDSEIIIRAADDSPAYIRTARLAFSVAGESVSRPYQILLKRIVVSVGDRCLDDLFSVVWHGKAHADQESTINSWNVSDSWGSFFCGQAMSRKFYEAMQFEDNACFIVHGDLECKFITPRFRATLPRFFNYPWKLFGESEGADPLSDLSDHDVIYGGEERLANVIERMLNERVVSGPMIINSTCVPVVIGDDVDKVMERFRDRCADGIFHLSPRTSDSMELMMQYLDVARETALRETSPEPGSIALVGFRAGRSHRELESLIGDCGISLKGSILPKASAQLMEEVMRAQTLVLRPSVFMIDMYERVFRGCGLRMIQPPAPFGFEGTAAWLARLGVVSGRSDQVETVVRANLEACRGELEQLRARASRHEMILVADPGEPSRLFDPVSPTGLPLLPLVNELGYGLRVLARNDNLSVYRDFVDRIGQWAAENGATVRIGGFGDEASLAAELESVESGAVFSEYFYDTRISRAGLPQFSARDFDMGFAGAIRTARRLLRLVETPFYRRYGMLPAAERGSAGWWRS